MDDQPTEPDRRWPTIAIILIVIGAIFFFGQVFNVRFGSGFWPLLILVPGLIFLATAFGGDEVNPGLGGAGAVLTTLGLIFFYQNASGHWESWAYIWALLPASVGLSQMVAGARNGDELLAHAGVRLARTFAIVFVVGLIFFELVIFDRGGVGGWLLPLGLIAAGAYMLWDHQRRGGDLPFAAMFRRPEPPAPPPSQSGTPSAPPRPAAPEAAAAVPPPAASTPPPPVEPFPEDELPEPPAPDSAPFPPDEESPSSPPAEAAKPKPRRRTTRKPKSSDDAPPQTS